VFASRAAVPAGQDVVAVKSFLAVSFAPGTPAQRRAPLMAAVTHIGPVAGRGIAVVHSDDTGWVAFGEEDPYDETADGAGFTVRLGRAARTRTEDVTTATLGGLLNDGTRVDGAALAALLPPFAAAHRTYPGGPIVVATDWLGFRQIFIWQGDGVAAVSTSALALRALAGAGPAGLNLSNVGLQSLVGWQVGLDTVFTGVSKVGDGSFAVLSDGRVRVSRYIERSLELDERPGFAATVAEMAELLSEFHTNYLADHPSTVLQLTGGQDTRVLLSAVPAKLRPGLRALTLDVHGGADARHAARLSELCGLDHDIYWVDDQAPITPATASELTLRAAAELDCMASPLALAPLLLAESNLDQGHRLSGLGGETCRGFYYFGQPHHTATSTQLVNRLATWRLYANEAVSDAVLEPDFAAAAQADALRLIGASFDGTASEWLRATDEFYLFQRMQRWSGAHGSFAAANRFFINPMFDRRFVQLAHAVSPEDKRGGRLTGQLIAKLDPALAAVPLDSGLIPAKLGQGGLGTRAASARVTAKRLARKIRQRVSRSGRAQLGANEMAALVVAHWRARPDAVAALRGNGIVRESWLDDVLAGQAQAPAATVAFLTNLLVATT
jgi:asparagine synthase (glutamine-hydrolysing)